MSVTPPEQVELAIAVVPPTPSNNAVNNAHNQADTPNNDQPQSFTISIDPAHPTEQQTQYNDINQSTNQSVNNDVTAAQQAVDVPVSNGVSPSDDSIQRANGAASPNGSASSEPTQPIVYPSKAAALAPASKEEKVAATHTAVNVFDENLLIPINELLTQEPYNTSAEEGLSSAEAEARLLRDGPNEFESVKPIPLWLAYFYQFANLLIILLMISSVVAYALNEYVEATAILIVVLVNVNLAVLSERNANNALAALMALSNPFANIARDGKIASVDSRLLVVGDIVHLTTGDVVPADCRVITASALELNEMILTGESVPVRKNPSPSRADLLKTLTPPNLLLSGTNVQGGNGVALIIATGARTRLGEIAKLVTTKADAPKQAKLDADGNPIAEKEPGCFKRASRKIFSRRPPKTSMQKSIHKLGLGLSIIAVCVCVLVFVVGIARGHANPDHPGEAVWLGMLLVAVSLAVSAIPEGLPLAVTVALSLGGQRLAKCKALVRRIAAVENLGTVNVICSDKTGTLTMGKMSVVQLSVGAQFYSTLGNQITPIGDDDDDNSRTDNASTLNANTNTVTNNNNLSVRGGEEKPKRKRSLLSPFFSNRTFLSTRSMQDRPVKKPAQGNPFTAQTLNDNNRNGNSKQAPYLRETLLVTRVATLCSNAKLMKEEGSKQAIATGNPTEAAIVLLADKVGLHADGALKQNPRIRELPFSSSKKMMFTIHDIQPTDHIAEILGATGKKFASGEKLFLTCGKGSPDMLLPLCSHFFAGQVKVEPMTDGHRASILLHIDEMARQALRVIAIVAKVTTEAPFKASSNDDEKGDGDDEEAIWAQQKRGLIMLGLLGIADPPRAGVGDAIDVARGAGIKTVMITGDYLTTARAIARNIRLISKPAAHNNPELPAPPKPVNEETVDCSVLRPSGEYLPDAELDALIPTVAVFARAQPRDKLEIVKSLQRLNLVAAMTGDGVNDSPALSQADIGIGMGSGTDVAKSASAIVLLDDQFPTIITAIKEGRSIYANIQKFIVFLLGTNAVQMAFILCCIVAGLPTPLTPLQILATNIITDALPALALSAMPAENDVMSTPPRNRKDFVIAGKLKWLTFWHAFSLVCILPTVYVIALYWSSGQILQDDILGLIDENADPNTPVEQLGPGCRVYSSDPPSWSRTFDTDCEKVAIRRGRTCVFLLLALAENCRPYTVRWLYYPFWHSLLSNIPLIGATALSLACLFVIMSVEPVQNLFGTDNLPWYDWILVIGCVLITVIVDEVVKIVLYKRNRSNDDDDDDEDKD